jgi:hypothetical protein
MNQKFAFIVVVMIGVFLLGCDHASHTSSHDEHKSHLNADQSPLVLNNGKRWETDAPTRAGMRDLKAKVVAFNAKEQAQLNDIKTLAGEIEGDVNTILQKCTMTGAGHVELHKFIAIALKDVEALRSSDLEDARAALKQLEDDILLFDRYFE